MTIRVSDAPYLDSMAFRAVDAGLLSDRMRDGHVDFQG
jgi:hypothetical protein